MRGKLPPWLLTVLATAAGTAFAQEDPLRAVVMPRDGGDVFDRAYSVVRPLDEAFLREWRALRDRALADGVKTLVLELTATDGDWITARQIVDDLADLRARGIATAAYVPEIAAGPAALVALEADRIILSSEGRVGGADPGAIAGAGASGKDVRTLRSEAALRATAAARRNGYPELFVSAMIDPDLEVVAVRRKGAPISYVAADRLREPAAGEERSIVVRKGETLVMSRSEAEAYGFPIRGAETRDDLRAALDLAPRPLADAEILAVAEKESAPATWFSFDWSLLLLLAGILFLILELKTPGLGVMGVLGVVALSAYFLVNAGGGPGSLFSIGFLFVGFLLLLVEILILPGFGVAGVLGIVLIVFSIYAATIDLPGATLREQLIPDGEADHRRVKIWLIQFMTVLAAGSGGALFLAPRLHRFPILNRAFLSPAILSASSSSTGKTGSVATAEGPLALAAGARGVAETDLRPSGVARLSERRVDVVADGEFVPRGSRVVVTAVDGLRVLVRRADDAT